MNDFANRTQIQIDVAVLGPQEPGRPRRILSLGEAKWGEVMGGYHVERLARARDLLSASHDTSDCVSSPATPRPDSTMIFGQPRTRGSP